MNAKEFKAAKGTKVYQVFPWNFSKNNQDEIVVSVLRGQENEPKPLPVCNIYEVTVHSAGDKIVRFANYEGMSRTLHYIGHGDERWFTTIEKAIAYVDSEYGKDIKIVKRHAFMKDYAAFKADTTVTIR